MQKFAHIFLTFLFLGICQMAVSQNDIKKIQTADSLFQVKKFTEALDIYEKVFRKQGNVSPNTLLKMSFIYEGLGDFTKALYFLNLYYSYAPDNQALLEMEKIAHEHRLIGYEHTDVEILKAFYREYFILLSSVLMLLSLLIFIFFVYKRLRKEKVHYRYTLVFILFLIGVFFFVNLSKEKPIAIISQDNTYLMNAPSAGADLVKILEKGHKLQVIKKQDIWYEVIWDKQTAYIREGNLLLVEP